MASTSDTRRWKASGHVADDPEPDEKGAEEVEDMDDATCELVLPVSEARLSGIIVPKGRLATAGRGGRPG